jgi:hypothetical protein
VANYVQVNMPLPVFAEVEVVSVGEQPAVEKKVQVGRLPATDQRLSWN